MAKIIRPTYPKEASIGLLLLVFSMAYLLSGSVLPLHGLNEEKNRHIGMFLLSAAVILMVLILWEELLFPVKIKPEEAGGAVYRNHRTKLLNQILLFLAIPVIFIFIYAEYEVNPIRYAIWAIVCNLSPVVGKLISGINNYNDFLKLTNDTIEYKNNHKTGVFAVTSLRQIVLIKDQRNVLHKVQLMTNDNAEVTIDLDEMEIADFVLHIDQFINSHYKNLVKQPA